MAKKKTAVVINKNGKKAGDPIALDGAAPLKIKALPNVKYLLKGEGDVGPENATLTRVGDDLHVTLEGETSPALVLEGFYALAEPSGIYGVAEDGQLYAYGRTDGGDIFSLADGQMAPVALAGDPVPPGPVGEDNHFAFWPLLLGGLGVAALAGVVTAIAREGGSEGVEPIVVKPPEPAQKPTTSGIGQVIDDQGPFKGPIANGGLTDDSQPEFTGRGEPGNKITITDKDGSVIGTATVAPDGSWSVTPDKPFTEGSHSVTVTETDKNGNTSDPSDPFGFEVDTTPPAPPHAKVDGTIDDTGLVKTENPIVSGTDGEPGNTITVTFPDGSTGTAEVGPDGSWSVTADSKQPEGDGKIIVVETDKAGNPSAPVELPVNVDTVDPRAPTFGQAIDDQGVLQGPLNNGDTTDDKAPTLTGKAEPGSTVKIYDGDEFLGASQVDANGNWTFTPIADLSEGEHVFTATATDAAGNTSDKSDEFKLTTDYTAPDVSKLAITGVEDNVEPVTGIVPAGGTTDDSQPLIKGTGTAGDTIIVSVIDVNGTHVLGNALVDSNGNWSLQVSGQSLASGDNTFTAIEMDPAGNMTDPSNPYTVTVDVVGPNAPVIENVRDDVGEVHFLHKGEATNDDTPTIIGTAQPKSLVKIYDGSTLLGSVQAGDNGKWEFTTDSLKDGPHGITATATDAAGQVSAPTGVWAFTVDTTPPAAVDDLQVVDNVGDQQGDLKDGDTTDDSRPTFSGKAEPKSTVTVYDGATKLGEAPVDDQGNWSFTPSTALPDGEHSFTTTVTDPAGNVSGATPPLNVTLDTTGVVVSIGAVIDDQGAVTGNITPNGVTDDARPEITGTGKPGSTITVYDGTNELGTTKVNPDGTWSLTPTGDLDQGAHSITAVAKDAAGNTSDPTSAFVFSVDTLAPNAPVIGSVTDDVGPKQDPLHSGDVTDDPSPTLKGTAEPGSIVTVYDKGEPLGSVQTDPGGNWTFTPTTGLPEGEHVFTTTATDAAGNTSDKSDEFKVITDYTPPDFTKLAITGVYDDQGEVTGNVAPGVTTDDSAPLISGTGTAGDKVIVSVTNGLGTYVLGSATVDASGKWELQVAKPLPSGSNEFTAVEADPAGNETNPSAGYEIVVSVTVPAVPVIENVRDDEGEVHNLQKGEVTDDDTPTIIGTSVAGNIIKVYDGSTLLGSTQVKADGTWEFTTGSLSDGGHDITATATNAVGQTSLHTGIWNFVVDTTAPDPVQGLVVTDDVGDQTGDLKNGDTTDDARPSFAGKAEPGSVVKVYDGPTLLGSAQVDGGGNWSLELPKDLPDGPHNFTTTVTDPAGNVSGPGEELNVTVDTSKLPVTITAVVDDFGPITGNVAPNGVTDDLRPEIQGRGKAGGLIELFDGAESLGTTTVKSDGTWSFTPSADLGQNGHSITVEQTDTTGNKSKAGPFNFSIDTVAPGAPVISEVLDDVDEASGTRALVNGETTNDPSPTLKGTAEAGSKVTVYDGDKVLGSVDADAQGNWVFTPTTPLVEGEHVFTAKSTDAAGNTSAESGEFKVITDYTPPGAPVLGGVEDDKPYIEGPVVNGGSTNDERPTISGTGGNSGEKVVIYDNGVKIGETDVNPDGSWSFTPDLGKELNDGPHHVEATNVDAAGNESAKSNPFEFTVDTQAPTQATTIEGVYDDVAADGSVLATAEKIGNGGYTNDTTPQLRGTLSDGLNAGEKVVILRDGAVIGEATVDGTGTGWSFDDAGLADGKTYIYTARVEDQAGNRGGISSDYLVHVDTSEPSQTVVITTVWDDVAPGTGDVANNGTTNDSQPELRGTLSSALAGNETLAVYRDGVKIGEAKVSGTSWTFEDTTGLDSGTSYSYEARVEDAAGNLGAYSSPYGITLELIGPDNRATITALNDDEAPVTGPVANNGWTNDLTPQLEGTLQKALDAGQKVVVHRDGVEVGEATVSGTGWTYADSGLADGGKYVYTVYVQDAADNLGAASNNWTVNVDHTPPSQTVVLTQILDNEGNQTGSIANGGVSDDDTPRLEGTISQSLSGTEEVRIFRNGEDIGKATLNGDGVSWWYQDASLSNKSTYSYEARVVDAAGNESAESNSISFTLDKDPGSQTVTILQVLDDQLPVTGTVAQNGTTNDATPLLSGSVGAALQAGEVVVIYRDGVKLAGTAVVNGTTWTYQDSGLVDEKAYKYEAVVVSAAGVEGGMSSPYVINFDKTAPTATAAIDSYHDDFAPQTGDFQSGSTTNDTTPLLNGSVTGALAAGEAVVVYRDGEKLGNAVVTGSTWTYQDGNLADGQTYSYTVRVEDAGGNQGTESGAFTLTVDTTAPGAPVLGGVEDDKPYIEGPVVNGGSTNDERPTISGTGGNSGEKVVIYDNGVKIGETDVNPDGSWSFTPDLGKELNDGPHHVEATNVDAAGNESTKSNPFEFTVDTQAPTQATTIEGVYDDVAADGSVLATAEKIGNGGYTNDTTPQLRGTLSDVLAAGEKVVVLRDGQVIGTATVNGTGWTFDDAGLADGKTYIYTARVEDQAGNRGGVSSDYLVHVDTSEPSQTVVITTVWDDVAPGIGDVANNGTTNDSQPELRGTLSSALAGNETLAVYRDNVKIGYATVDGTGTNWKYVDTTGQLENHGSYSYEARVEDAAGNLGANSSPYGITLELIGPDNRATITALNDDEAPVTGPVANNGWTNDLTPQLEGTLQKALDAGQKVVVYRDGVEVGEATVSGTGWTYADSGLADGGKYVYTVYVQDAADNLGAASNNWTVNVDHTPPSQTVVLTQILDNEGNQTGSIANGGVSDDDTPRLEGTISQSLSGTEEVRIFRNGEDIGKATLNGDGVSWWYQDASLSNKSTYSYEARVVDAAGNESAESNSISFTLDKDPGSQTVTILQVLDDQLPVTGTVAQNGTTNDATPLLSGSVGAALQAGEVVVIYRDGVKLAGTAVVNGTTWTYQDSGLVDEKAYKYEAVVVSAAGVEGGMSSPYVINFDKTAPTATAAIDSYHDDFAPQTGDFQSGSTTNDTTPLLNGTVVGALGAGEVVVVYRDGEKLGNAVVTGSTWTYQDGNLADGQTYSYTVRVEDAGGNQGTESGAFTLTVDTTPPSLTNTIEIKSISDDTGTDGDFITTDNTLTVNGTLNVALTADEHAQISIDGGNTWVDVVVDGTGVNWSYVDTRVLPAGEHTYDVRVVDLAGNVGDTDSKNVTVVPVAGTNTITIEGINDDTGLLGNDFVTSDKTLDVFGTLRSPLDAGSKVQIQVDSGAWVDVTNVNGVNWSYQYTDELSEGSHTYVVRVIDAAAAEIARDDQQVTIDTQAPTNTTTVDLATESDWGLSSTDNITSNVTPTIKGKVGTGSDSDLSKLNVTLFDDVNKDGKLDAGDRVYSNSISVAADGSWTYDLPSLRDGSYKLSALVTDRAGNASSTVSTLDGNNSSLVIDSNSLSQVIQGAAANDNFSYDVASIGDFNGDGYEDLMVVAPMIDRDGPGAAYILFGSAAGIDLVGTSISSLTPAQGLVINGPTPTSYTQKWMGLATNYLGDINGDGYADIVMGSQQSDKAYVVFGGANGTWANGKLSLAAIDQGQNQYGFSIKNGSDQAFAVGVGSADLNGDGYADLLVGNDQDGAGSRGSGTLIYGHGGNWSNIQLVQQGNNWVLPSGVQGTTILAAGSGTYANADLGRSINGVGDVNGDDIEDFVITDPNGNNPLGGTNGGGTAYLIYGNKDGLPATLDLGTLTPDQGIRINGMAKEHLGDLTGTSGATISQQSRSVLTGLGDINGDGIDDFAIAAPSNPGVPGRVWVIYGKEGGYGRDINLDALFTTGDSAKPSGYVPTFTANDGFLLVNEKSTASNQTESWDVLGSSIRGIGDANGDGISDFIVGAMRADSDGKIDNGAAYVVYGRSENFDASVISIADIVADPSKGYVVRGEGGVDLYGSGVTVGDWNGDGVADIAVGASLADSGSTSNTGALYIYYGTPNFTQEYTTGDDTLVGTAGVDFLSGGFGNDTISQIGANDVALGGAGNDTIRIVGTNFKNVDGGAGIDTLVMDGRGMNIDLALLQNKVQGFERFDLGNGGNTLNVNLGDVSRLGQTNQFIDDGKKQLVVNGDGSGQLNLVNTQAAADHWTDAGTKSVDGTTYHAYTNVAGTTELLVDDRVHVTIL